MIIISLSFLFQLDEPKDTSEGNVTFIAYRIYRVINECILFVSFGEKNNFNNLNINNYYK